METFDKLNEIYAWIDTIPLSRQKKNIARDFSDAVLMAELLKKYYPKYVELHNYNAGNSLSKKIYNWDTLNRKVLSKLNLKLKNETIERLAKSENGVIERVLISLRNKIINDCNADSESVYFSNDEDKGIDCILEADEELMKRPVSRHSYLKLKQQLEEKNKAIYSLNEKVIQLESLIHLKDQKIIELQSRYHDLVGLDVPAMHL